MRTLLCLLACSMPILADSPIIFGARGGIPFNSTNTVLSRLTGESPLERYTIGPTIGVRLPLGFSVEADALYNRRNQDLVEFQGFTGAARSSSWQFPVMLKFTAGRQSITPVVGAGFAVRHTNDFASVPSFLVNGERSTNNVGFVAGGGVRFKAGPVNITPELRYTYWNGGSFTDSLLNFLPFQRHEASVLLGITF